MFKIHKPYDGDVRSILRFITLSLLLCHNAADAAPEVSGSSISYEDDFTVVVLPQGEIIDDNFFLKADEIRYDRVKKIANAVGNVELTYRELRILSDALEYNFETNAFTAKDFRAGLPPLMIVGDTITGAPGLVTVDRGDFYYGEPGPFAPKVSASGVELIPNESFRTKRARLSLGKVPLLSLPEYSSTIGGQSPEIDAKLGYRSFLGAYAQTEILVPVSEGLLVGANLDLYTSRGVLLGPAARYDKSVGNVHYEGHLSTGWVKDQGDTEASNIYPGQFPNTDPDNDRGFILWNNRTSFSDELELVSSLSYLDDSDVLRDFRRDFFNDTQDPDSYATLAWTADPVYLTLHARPRINRFQSVVERLPELRADLPWIPFFATDAYQSGHVSIARLRWNPNALGGAPDLLDPWIPTSDNELWEQSRIDIAYGIQKPINVSRGITLTPLASVRGLSYETKRFDGQNESSQERIMGEIGADLRSTLTGTWDFENPFWDINGVRHLLEPVVSYRYRAGDDLSDADIFPIDRLFDSVHLPTLDLLDNRATDTLDNIHLVRVGVENTLLTRSDKEGIRSLASLNAYYDALLDSGDTLQEDSFYTELSITPANWLEFDFFTRWDSEETALDAVSTRVTLKSGDLWRLSFFSSYLDGVAGEDDIEQFGSQFRYQFSQRFGFGARLRYDNNFGGFTEQVYTIAQRFGRHLELEYGVKFTKGSDREDDFGIALRGKFINF